MKRSLTRFALSLGLLCFSGAAFAQETIAIVSANGDPQCDQDLTEVLRCTGEFARIDVFDAATGTPTPAQLDAGLYDAVIVVNDGPFADPVALGDTLYTFAQGGGGVVLTANAFASGTAVDGLMVSQGMMPVQVGTWATSQMGALTYTAVEEYAWRTGPIDGHLANYGANNCSLGGTSVHVAGADPIAPAYQIGELSNGEVGAVALEGPNASWGNVVALNVWAAPSSCDANGFVRDGDFDRLLAGALTW